MSGPGVPATPLSLTLLSPEEETGAPAPLQPHLEPALQCRVRLSSPSPSRVSHGAVTHTPCRVFRMDLSAALGRFPESLL